MKLWSEVRKSVDEMLSAVDKRGVKILSDTIKKRKVVDLEVYDSRFL